MPYLPESFYGGDRSSMTPYMDEIRRQEQKAAASGQPPLPADVKPAQPVVKPAGEEAAAAAPAAPTYYADMLRGVSAGNAPAPIRGAGPSAGLPSLVSAGRPPTLEIPKALTVEEAQTRAKQFFDIKELSAQQDRIAETARERLADTLSFARTNKPPAPFQELSKRLNTEEFNEVSEKEKAKGMALMMAGLKMMESPYGGKGLGSFLRNVGAGATVGAKELQQSNKEFKELAQKRLQLRTTIEAAQNAAERGDFDRELVLRQRGDELNNSMDQNKALLAKYAFGLEGQAAIGAFDQSAQTIEAAKREQFRAENEAYLTGIREQGATTRHAQSEAGATARSDAQIAAQRQSDLFKAQLPPESIRAAGYLGGAPPGTLPTPAQVEAGLKIMNSEKFNVYTAYSKYVTDWKKDPNPANLNDKMMTFPEYMAMFGAGKVVDKLPANALVRNPQ
jgi:hypothetical protein